MKILISWKNPWPEAYLKALFEVGLEPTFDESEFDGLLLTGGGDVDPILYSEKNSFSQRIIKERDATEYRYLDLALMKNVPILGICRGCQVINVYFGGSLYQDINTSLHRPLFTPTKIYNYHKVENMNGSIMSELYGSECIVSSFHHQAIKRVANDFKITQIAEDGIIEATEHTKLPIIAVQWHPEKCIDLDNGACNGLLLFKKFAEMCEKA